MAKTGTQRKMVVVVQNIFKKISERRETSYIKVGFIAEIIPHQFLNEKIVV